MGVIETRTFKSGNSVAVRLPRELGFDAGAAVTIERRGDALVIKAAEDPEEGRRRVARLVAALEAIGPVGEIEKREQPEAPIRPGL